MLLTRKPRGTKSKDSRQPSLSHSKIYPAIMPRYTVFMIIANRCQANVTSDDSKAKRRDPAIEEWMHKVLAWIDDEVRAKQIESSEVLLDSSERLIFGSNFMTRTWPLKQNKRRMTTN